MHQYFFFVSPDRIKDNLAELTGDDFHHCVQVLRKRVGDMIALLDGTGQIYQSVIQSIGKKSCVCRIRSRQQREKSLPATISLAFGLVKNRALESIIRDMAALGVTEIVPLNTQYSVKQAMNPERARKIAVESIKQSGNFYLPKIENVRSLPEWLAEIPPVSRKLLADMRGTQPIGDVITRVSGSPVIVLVGPEGGFSDEETGLAENTGFVPVRLHAYRLRTELAAVAAVATVCALIS